MRLKVALFSAVFGVLCAVLTAQSSRTNSGVISGVVEDPSEARIPRAKVEARNEDRDAITAVANEAGEFRLEVPAGVYTLEVGGIRGFNRFTRPKFRVRAGEALMFPVSLEVAKSDCGSLDALPGNAPEPDPLCNLVQQTVAKTETGEVEMVIEFLGRTGTGVTREFSSATAYCDVYSVRADQITYHSGTKEATAEGRVEIGDGHSTKRAKTAVIKFPECRPVSVE